MEKFKNFLYDMSDNIINMSILLVLVLVIALKLNTAIPDIHMFSEAFDKEENVENLSDKVNSKIVSIDLTSQDVKVNEKVKQTDENKANVSITPKLKQDITPDVNVQPNVNNEQTEKPKTPEQQPAQDPTQAISITIQIPSGYGSNQIAKLLHDNNLIKDEKAFLDVVKELNYNSSLRSGKHTLSSDMTYEEMARKIAGK